jgi:small conductance mechanosensitive channel
MDIHKLVSQFSEMALHFAPKFLFAVVIFVLGNWVINRVTKLFREAMISREIESTIRPFLASLVSVGLKVMLMLSVAGMFGIETTSFIAIFTALTFAVGTALSGSLGHFASGILILIFKPYKVGDFVTLAAQTGVVTEIQVFNTVLLTGDNKKIIIPNGSITSGVMVNISGQGQIRVDMVFQVNAENEIDFVRSIIQGVADSSSIILKDPSIDILVQHSPPGTIEFAVRPWCESDHYWEVYYSMHENILKAFAKANVKLL